MTEPQDKCRLTRVQAQDECNAQEALQNTAQLCPQLRDQTHFTMSAPTLSLAKFKGDNAVSSLVKEHQWNNWWNDMVCECGAAWMQYYPDWDQMFTAFELAHTQDNAHKYYVVAWRRTKFINTMITVHCGNCPICYKCLPIAHNCPQCVTHQVSSKIYFQPLGNSGARPAIPHELAKACDELAGLQLITDDLQLSDNKALQNNATQSHHEICRFLRLTSDIFRNGEFMEGRMECTLQIPRAPIRAAVDALVVEHYRQQANNEQQ